MLKFTIILDKLKGLSASYKVFRKYFLKNKPARTTFAGDLLVGYKTEIDILVVRVDGFKDERVN